MLARHIAHEWLYFVYYNTGVDEMLARHIAHEWLYFVYYNTGVDEMLARHIAHLFIRDPISLFSEKLQQNDEEDTDHFEVRIHR